MDDGGTGTGSLATPDPQDEHPPPEADAGETAPNLEGEPAPQDSGLDNLLDTLIEEKISDPAAAPTDSTSPFPGDNENLDDLLDDLLKETDPSLVGGPVPNAPEKPFPEAEATVSPLHEKALDALWDEAVKEGVKEESAAGEIPDDPELEAVTDDAKDTETGLEPEVDLPTPAAAATTPEDSPVPKEVESNASSTEEIPSGEAPAEEAPTEAAPVGASSTEEAPASESSGEDAPTGGTPAGGDSEEDLWAQAFADQAAVESEQQTEEVDSGESSVEEILSGEAPASESSGEEIPTGGTPAGDDSEEDLWAQAFADQAAVEDQQAVEGEAEGDDVAAQTQALLDDPADGDAPAGDPWNPAPAGDEKPGAATADEATGLEDVPEEELAQLASLQTDDAEGLGLAAEALEGYNEEDYPEPEDDDFEAAGPAKRKLGPVPLPSGKMGRWILAGSVAGVLLLAGSVYFGLEIFAPEELREMGLEAEAPAAGGTEAEQAPQPGGTESTAPEAPEPTAGSQPPSPEETAASGGTAEETTGAAGPNAIEEAKGLLEKPQPAAASTAAPTSNVLDSLSLQKNMVTMNTMMPVAYSPTDIKVLSISLDLEFDSPEAVQSFKNVLPIYERLMVSTVENFLKRKFYEDILYAQEKLSARLEKSINKKLKKDKIKIAKIRIS
ncbi:MAG: hypothetical protein ACE5ER_00170 [Nitrospinaceae bacterium]